MKREDGKKQMEKGMEEISRDRRKWEDGRKWKKMGGQRGGKGCGRKWEDGEVGRETTRC